MTDLNSYGRQSLLQQGPTVEEEPLLAVEQRIVNIMGLSESVRDDDHLEQFGRELDRLDTQVRSSIPRTPAGIAVKIRHLWSSASMGADEDDLENLKTIHKALRLLEEDGDDVFDESPFGGQRELA